MPNDQQPQRVGGLSRRRWLAASAAAGLAVSTAGSAEAAPAPPATAIYDYLFLSFAVDRARSAPRDFAGRLAEHKALVTNAGGELVGYFAQQLGWGSDEAALILRWPAEAPGREAAVAAVAADPALAAVRRDRLTPTLRPGPTDLPPSGGIFVHRLFEIAAADKAEFVDLSGKAWGDFEGGFDSDIFGLFETAQTAAEARSGRQRMLLITRYADHGVWEASRQPSARAADLFARRHALTIRTSAASTVLALGPARAAVDVAARDQAIAGAMTCLDAFMSAFNARDVTAFEATFNFPSIRIASGKVALIEPGYHKPEMFDRGPLAEWDHSAWERRRVIHAGPDKVHVDTRFSRYRKDGSLIGGFDSVYVVTLVDGHWGVQARSSFAP